jgi:glutamate racemase
MTEDPEIDTLLLGCTHYPILLPKIEKYVPEGVRVIAQGGIVGDSLADYLRRHPEMDARCSKNGTVEFLTTENAAIFDRLASLFMETPVESTRITL